jgi:UDP-glucose 4-epimerase
VRILITGGFGFIGGRLGKYLSEQGFEIILGSRKNLNPPEWLPSATTARTTWGSESELAKICTDVDVVIHAAGMNAQDCIENPKLALEFNGLATARLVNAAIESRVKVFIYISTVHVYAGRLVGNIDENTLPVNSHPYATSHIAGEKAVLKLTNLDSMQTMVLRISNAFGYPTHPDTDCWGLLINDLCKQVVQTKKLELKSSGIQLRNFITMTDLCKSIYQFLLLSQKTALPKIINVGSNQSNSVYEMAELVQTRCAKVLKFTPEIKIDNELLNPHLQQLELRSLYRSLFETIQDNDREKELDILIGKCKSWFVDAVV